VGEAGPAPFRKLLVANRGEIAIRVMRACRELGIASVAVFSDADRRSRHVRYADEAYCIGPPPAVESYLSIPRIMEVAARAGVDAVHPGYGFLAEDPNFAQACRDAGITFVGPSPESMRLLGDKIHARALMRRAGIPVTPGTEEIADPEEAIHAARALGYPVMVKAAAGGGGRGIRRVDSEDELRGALAVAAAEAAAAFGQGRVYLEKLLRPVRHVEVQLIADRHGNVVALGERECSIQRRHQKMIEECPSPAVDGRLRDRLTWAAVTAAHVSGYENAGTVEFLLDADGNFYFLEMNTRLQVEHPVTEIVAGVDLVAEQILVAAGHPLSYTQESLPRRGWAIECRIVAEDPRAGFVPSVGEVAFAREPAGPGVRVESALYDGFQVSMYYDPLVAKVTAWGRDRDEAIRRMTRALGEFQIVGVQTNIPFHLEVMASPAFRRGELSTDFLTEHAALPAAPPDEERQRAALIAAALLTHGRTAAGRQGPSRNGVAPGWKIAARDGVGHASQAVYGRSGWRRGVR
jgi:acetyl-CoA carboxylase biotin carboxylase subunit